MSDKLAELLEGFYNFRESMEKRFDRLEDRFDKLENRFDSLETRFNSLEEKVNEIAKDVKDIKRTQTTNRRQIAEKTLDISDIKEKLKIS